MNDILISLPGNEEFAGSLAKLMNADMADVTFHHFPDGETYVRFETDVVGRTVWLVCTLDRPDPKFVPLMITAETAKDLGAARVGLISPYLAYMRQDTRFRSGEAVSSAYFASVLSCVVDVLITVDPHLHRHTSLGDIYSIPTSIVHAAPAVADWIRREVERPLLVGPDEESEQWVAEVAQLAQLPHIVLRKIRRGDRNVEVSVPDVERWGGHTPVLIDDIASTGRTMIETIHHLRNAGLASPVCVAVHAIFASEAFAELSSAGADRIVSCNTILHPSNLLDLSPQIADAAGKLEWSSSPCCSPARSAGQPNDEHRDDGGMRHG